MGNKNEQDQELASPMGLPPDLNSIIDDDTEGGQDRIQTLRGEQPDDNAAKKRRTGLFGRGKVPVIEGYEIDRKLGQGGMGSVYLATDQTLMRQVAIKIVTQSFREDSGQLDRFEAEIQTLAALKHPNIAQLYSAGSCQDLPYFVMEFVDGATLESYAKQPLKSKEAAAMVSKLCEAVAYCHENGVLHRDLKPSNVLLDEKQQPKIADFGLAKAIDADSSNTRTGEILGTPGFMAPEQASGVVRSFTAACDIYALGAILYRLLTGRPPFVAAEPWQAVMQVLAEDPVPPRRLVGNIPIDLQTICLKCLDKKAAKRYQSANELRADLQCFLDGKPVSARPAGVIEKSAKWINRNRVKALLLTTLGALGIAALFGLSWHNQVLSGELAKTKRLADHGSELSNWLISDHLNSLSQIVGTTKPRHEVTSRVRVFLDASYADIPPDVKYTRRLGRSYAQLAAITGGVDQNNLGDHEQAEEYYLRALQLYDRASEQDRQDLATRQLRVSSLLGLSGTYLELKKPKEGERYFRQAKRAIEQWNEDDWRSQLLAMEVLSTEADWLMARNEFEAALKVWQEFEEQLVGLSEDANQQEVEHRQVLLGTNRGDCLSNLGQHAEAEAAFRDALEIVEQNAQEDPNNVLFQIHWSAVLGRLGSALYSQEKTAEALVCYQEALEISKKIVAGDVDNVEAVSALATKHANISDLLLYMNDIPAAEESIDEAIEILQTLRDKNQLGLWDKRQMAICMQSKANLVMMSGDLAKAKQLYEQHDTFCQDLITTDRDSIPELTQLAENYFQHSLLMLSAWMEKEFDASTARESQAYLDIIGKLDQCEDYFKRIAEAGSLNSDQLAIRERTDAVRELIEETIDQLIEAKNAEGRSDF